MTTLDTIDARIAVETDKLLPPRAALAKLAAERLPLQAASQTAASTLSAATTALTEARAGHALGEVTGADLGLARASFAAAEKVAAKARQTEPEVAGLIDAEMTLTARISGIEATLAGLRAERAKAAEAARIAAMVVGLHARAETYLRSAETAARDFAAVLALDEKLTAEGKAQDFRTPDVANACFPNFRGHPSKMVFADVMAAEKLKVFATFGPR